MGAGFGYSAFMLAREDVLPALDAALAAANPSRTGRSETVHDYHITGEPRATLLLADS
jgi:hypothetical protein